MKKVSILAVALLISTFAFSQSEVSTRVNIILADVISFDNSSVAANGIVDFNYTTADDYNSAKNVTVPNSLIVTSSNNFDIKVKAEGANFTNTASTDVIPVGVLQIKVVSGGTMVGAFTTAGIRLSATDQTLVSSAPFGALKSLNIDYSITALNAQTELLGKDLGTYTQQVTYSAVAL